VAAIFFGAIPTYGVLPYAMIILLIHSLKKSQLMTAQMTAQMMQMMKMKR